MKYRRLGKSELKVSCPGFGGIPITTISPNAAEKCIGAALDLGINFIDTARAYKDSEYKIGKALKSLPIKRENIILATKALPGDIKDLRSSLEESLKNLQTDYIDLFQLHNISNQEKLDHSMELTEEMENFKKQGKIRHIGVTVHGVDWVNTVIQTGIFETVMVALNFIVKEPVEVVLPLARKLDIGVIAMKPMAGGEIDNPALAFKFFLDLEDVVPVVGINKPEHIVEIAEIFEKTLVVTEEDIREMERIRRETGEIFCRRCGYCTPCPQGVDIVSLNVFPSIIKRYPPLQMAKAMEKSLQSYQGCVDCGECEQKCPYELAIRDMMKRSYNTYLRLMKTGA